MLTGLLSFMLGSEDTVGSISTPDEEKRVLARASHAHNRRDKVFRELFPDFLRDSLPETPRRQRAVVQQRSSVRGQRGRADDNESESLLSLLAWLLVFLAVIFVVFRLITQSA